MFLTQVLYLAVYDKKLFKDDFKTYENGPVIEEILKSYGLIVNQNNKIKINDCDKLFLDKVYMSLENATFEDLIEITHEDPTWQQLSNNTYNAPIMNIEDNIDEYKKRYKGLIEALKL